MQTTHEIIKTPKALLAWVYRHSENQIVHVCEHWHLSLEITLVLKGAYLYKIQNQTILARTGSLLLINPGAVHACDIASDELCDAISIIFPHEFLLKACETIDCLSFSLEKRTQTKEYQLLLDAMGELTEQFMHKEETPNYQLMLNSLVYKIIFLLINNFSDSIHPSRALLSQKYMKQCEKIMQYIDDNYKEPISLETTAHHLGITREHLARLVRTNMGTTFKKYLFSIRLYHAYLALTTTDLSILDIALEQGFPDNRSFIKCFREVYGVTPSMYRKSHEHLDINHSKNILSLY